MDSMLRVLRKVAIYKDKRVRNDLIYGFISTTAAAYD
jgi:hypothetical protein